MKFLTAILGALIVSASLFSLAPRAYACSVMAGWPPSPRENAASRSLVFAGSVKSVIQDKSIYGDYRVTFSVAETAKGDVGSTVTLRMPGSSAACGYDDGYSVFTEGSAWVIFADGDASEGYHTNAVSGNTKYATLAKARAALADTKQPAVSVPQQDLTMGSRGSAVTWLQQRLIAENAGERARALKSVGATGNFGSLTRAALAEYQKAKGITPAQGYFGAKTRAYMAKATTPSVPANGSVTLRGTTGCLPPKDPSKPTIALCAYGLKADDGNYYALEIPNEGDDAKWDYAPASEGRVEVTGTFTKKTDATWASVGVIKVKKITAIQ